MRKSYLVVLGFIIGMGGCGDNLPLPVCGDGTVDADEQCDDGNTLDGDGCQATCLLPACGDGVVDPGEACDDGNTNNGDGTCQANCTLPGCGDGVVDPEEECDDGGESATCNATCTAAACGDGEVNATAGEACDDGNTVDGDGTCQANCALPTCGDSIPDPGEECDDGVESATCDADCTMAACGDGTVNAAASEECDDSGESATCDANCTAVSCGDGDVNNTAGEACDDSNNDDLDGCSANCMSDESCGNMYLDVLLGETCDDGNNTPGDGCAEACAAEPYQVCSTDIPVTIVDNMTVSSALMPPFPYIIDSIDVELDVSHTLLNDLTINLSNGATNVLIADNFDNQSGPGNPCTGDDMTVILDDEAMVTLESACVEPGPPAIEGRVSPEGNLADFVGTNAAGAWMMSVEDTSAGEVGSIDRWCLNLNGFGVPQGGGVFWANVGSSVWGAGHDGSDPTELVTGISDNFEVAVDPVTGTIFYDQGSPSVIVRADLDGSNPTTIVNGDNVFGLDVDSVNGKLYWSEFNMNQIWRSDLDGSNSEAIISGIGNPSGLAVDPVNNKLYVITYNSTALYSANLDGTGLTTIVPGLGGQGVGVAVDSSTQKVYFSTRGNDIFVCDSDGSNQATLITGQGAVQGLDIDPGTGKIYWSAVLAGMIRRADYSDGGNIEDVTPSNGNSWGVAVRPTP